MRLSIGVQIAAAGDFAAIAQIRCGGAGVELFIGKARKNRAGKPRETCAVSSPDVPGREPVTIVELEQKRCSLRFGSAPCSATGTPKCYQTYSTCRDKENYSPIATIKWRFVEDKYQQFAFGVFDDPDAIEANPIPCLVSVSTAESKINPGSILDGKSPFGVTAKVTIKLTDVLWDDHVGDFYVDDRPNAEVGRIRKTRGGFWSLFQVRNEISPEMTLRIYDGYVGQALSEMRQRLYLLDRIDGPNSDGSVTITGLDPLRLTDDEKAEFPRTSRLDLFGSLSIASTSVLVIGVEADVSDNFGMDGGKYLRIGNEIISYAGYADQGNGVYLLTGVARGVLGTAAEAHGDQDKCQRSAHFENEQAWRVVDYLLRNHTPMPPAFLNLPQWDEEGNQYIPTNFVTRTLSEPQSVKELCGQLSQQGLFNIWWAEFEQKIKMLAVRPPNQAPVKLTDEANNLDGTRVTMDPDARLTRVVVFYDLKGPLRSIGEPESYRYRFTSVDDEVEGITGGAVTKVIYAPWIKTRSMAVALSVKLLIRYRLIPRFMVVYVDAKDRDVQTGTVADVETASFVDAEGERMVSRWLVTGSKEVVAGHTYMLDLQTYEYVGRFAVYMADGSPDFENATEAERQSGGWFSDDNGKLADGSDGYRYQ